MKVIVPVPTVYYMVIDNCPPEVIVQEIPDAKIRAQFIRFGIGEGTKVKVENIGTVVLINEEIAIGRKLAKTITVI